MVRDERLIEVREKAQQVPRSDCWILLLPPLQPVGSSEEANAAREYAQRTREKFREQLRDGRLDGRFVEVDVRDKAFPSFEIIAGSSVEEIDINVKDMLPGLFQGRTRKRRMMVPEAIDYLVQEEEQKLVDMESVGRAAVERVEQAGIIFIDEIDKIAGREGGHGPDVSREGVQRDILPIVEGTTVNTKHGMARTDHILFIAAGAFHVAKPSDLIPELQGRFPIRVELEPLGKDEFVRILTEPKGALVTQYTALLATEGIQLRFLGRDHRPRRRLRHAGQRAHREHRRAPLHTVMESCWTRSRSRHRICRTIDHNRRGLRRPYARGHRQERRSLSIHPVTLCGGCRSAFLCLFLLLSVVACGKRGPPLAPLRLVPASVGESSVRRIGQDVFMAFTIPDANSDATTPADISRVEVYGLTAAPLPPDASPLTDEEFREVATLAGRARGAAANGAGRGAGG